jgi:hypothetical protein
VQKTLLPFVDDRYEDLDPTSSRTPRDPAACGKARVGFLAAGA